MWYKGKEEILKQLETSSKGITNSEANKRLKEEGLNRIPTGKRNTIWNIIIEQLKNPIIFILFFSFCKKHDNAVTALALHSYD